MYIDPGPQLQTCACPKHQDQDTNPRDIEERHSQQMQRQARNPQNKPHQPALPTNTLQIANAQNPNINPSSPRMRSIYLPPRRRRQTLHAIIARRQHQGAQRVNHQMGHDIVLFANPTIPLKQRDAPVDIVGARGTPHRREDQVD